MSLEDYQENYGQDFADNVDDVENGNGNNSNYGSVESIHDSGFVDEINNQKDVDAYVSNLVSNNTYLAGKVAANFSEIKFNNPDVMFFKVWENLGSSDWVSKNHLTDYFIKKLTDKDWNNQECIFKFVDKALSESYGYIRYTCLKNIGNICDKLDDSLQSQNVISRLAYDAFEQQKLNPFASKSIVDNFDKIINKVYNEDFARKIINFVLNDNYDYNKSILTEKLNNVNPEIKDKLIVMIDNENPDKKLLEKVGD